MKPYYVAPDGLLYQGNVLDVLRELPPESVHCCVTSPPYWGLRTYNVDGQIGLEATIAEYIAKMVEVFREARRVLRRDGTLWLNIGDSYAGYHGNGKCPDDEAPSNKPGYIENMRPHFDFGRQGETSTVSRVNRGRAPAPISLKPKDLCMVPARVALALQADGWWLRSDIVWAKPNPMPESVTDRPTKAHEYIFLLSKAERYFYDGEAVREEPSPNTHARWGGTDGPGTRRGEYQAERGGRLGVFTHGESYHTVTSRNARSVWTIATEPYNGAHFATFPSEIPRRAILAGTSEHGCCPECGAPWRRVTEKGLAAHDGHTQSDYPTGTTANRLALLRQAARQRGGEYANEIKTLGWQRTCKHELTPLPATVLDPFMGSGTTATVARSLGRRWIGIDLSEPYLQLAIKRIEAVSLPLPQA